MPRGVRGCSERSFSPLNAQFCADSYSPMVSRQGIVSMVREPQMSGQKLPSRWYGHCPLVEMQARTLSGRDAAI